MVFLRAIGRVVATIVVLVWAALDELIFPFVRPLIGWLGRLRLFEQIGALIARLPPYAVLVVLLVPFVLVEPLKVLALYWIATGLFVRGIVLLVVSYLLSIFTLDRIYHVGRGQLMKIAWFARLMGWIGGLRDRALTWIKSTPAWQSATRLARGVRDWFRTLVHSGR
ncbi:MAG: hypothetical protein ABI697_12380 [Devosia sp.]